MMNSPKLALYYAPTACSMVPWILLTEAGAEFETRLVNLGAREQMSSEFLRVNPKHRVPVLVIDGEPLTENVAIQLWIARQFPRAGLMPEESMAFSRAVSILAWCAAGIHPTLTPHALPDRFCDMPGSADSVRRCAQKLLLDYLAIADAMLDKREWFFDHFTCADTYFFWCFRRAQQFDTDVERFANCRAHFARMQARDSVKRLLAFEAQVIEQFRSNAASAR